MKTQPRLLARCPRVRNLGSSVFAALVPPPAAAPRRPDFVEARSDACNAVRGRDLVLKVLELQRLEVLLHGLKALQHALADGDAAPR